MPLLISAQKLPGINFETPVGITDLGFEFDQVFAAEQRNRLQVLTGGYLSGHGNYGIVDSLNPDSVIAGDLRPLSLKVNSLDALRVDVQPGVASTPAGNIIILGDAVTSLGLVPPLQTPAANATYVVYLEYVVIDDPDTLTLTRYQTVEARRRMIAPVEQVLKAAKLSDYQNPSTFPPTRLNDVVVIALVTVNSAGTALVLDFSNNLNSFNRPWFSAVDIAHRSLLGTGSDLVPHSLGLNDLSQGMLTLYQQLLRFGQVLSKDWYVDGCPGKLNAEFITNPRVLTDGSGQVTGTAGQRYVRLLAYPVRLLAARSNDASGGGNDGPLNDIAVGLLPNSNILLIPTAPNETMPTNGFTLYYTSSSAVEPPVAVLTTDILQFGTPDPNKELYITGGKAFATLPTTTLQVSQAGPFPKQYTVFIDGSQQYVLAPQIIVCSKYVEPSGPFNGVGTTVQPPDFAMYGPAHVVVGLTQILPVPAVDPAFTLTVQLVGKDATGATIQENLVFNAANYFPVPIPTACGFGGSGYVVDPPQYLTSQFVYSSLTSWQVVSHTNDVPQTAIMLFADIQPPVTAKLDDALSLMVFRWNGQAVCNDLLRDVRPVSMTLARSEFMDRMLADLNTLVASLNISGFSGGPSLFPAILAAEDFNEPHWLDQLRSKRNRFADGLRSYFRPETTPTFGTVFGTDPDLGQEFYYTRAIALPLTSGQQNIFLHIYGTRFENISSQQKVQYRLATQATPMVWGAWTNTSALATNYTRRADISSGGPYLKVQFRFILNNIRGFTALMTGV